ncbi:MAG: hypothetical protein ABR936_00275 [Bacteroidota bacterium]|jgi:hypothetical protein
METTQENNTFKRRSFFLRVFGGIAGGWIARNLFSGFIRTTTNTGSKEIVQVTINPLAVPRMNKDATSHGA